MPLCTYSVVHVHANQTILRPHAPRPVETPVGERQGGIVEGVKVGALGLLGVAAPFLGDVHAGGAEAAVVFVLGGEG